MDVSRSVLLLRPLSSILVGRWSGGRRWRSRWCEGGTLVVAAAAAVITAALLKPAGTWWLCASKRTPKGNPRKLKPPEDSWRPREALHLVLFTQHLTGFVCCGGILCLSLNDTPLISSHLLFFSHSSVCLLFEINKAGIVVFIHPLVHIVHLFCLDMNHSQSWQHIYWCLTEYLLSISSNISPGAGFPKTHTVQTLFLFFAIAHSNWYSDNWQIMWPVAVWYDPKDTVKLQKRTQGIRCESETNMVQ